MRHYVLTRAAYGSAWSEDANRNRLELLRGITVPSLAAQTAPWTWVVLLDRADPLIDERRAALDGAGAPVRCIHMDTRDRSAAPKKVAAVGYWADWAGAFDRHEGITLTTRLDDDDALAPDALHRIRSAAEDSDGTRCVWMLPKGVRVHGGRYQQIHHETNAWATLQSPPGDTRTVYGFSHKYVADVAEVRMVDDKLGWLWARHPDTLSRTREVSEPITDELRAAFPIDWSLVE